MPRIFFVLFIGLFATLVWNTIILLPFKLLMVLTHEICHGIAALLGGAHLEQIHINLSESGETLISQLNSDSALLLTVSAGYLGSAFTGGVLIQRGLVASGERITLIIFATILAYFSYLFCDPGSLAYIVGLTSSLAMFVIGFAHTITSRYALLLLGTLFAWYSLFDLLDFTLENQQTDAAILATQMLSNNWQIASSYSHEELTLYISMIWSGIIIATLTIFFYPFLRTLQARYLAPKEEVSKQEMIPKEIDEWLLSKKLQWDGEKIEALEIDALGSEAKTPDRGDSKNNL